MTGWAGRVASPTDGLGDLPDPRPEPRPRGGMLDIRPVSVVMYSHSGRPVVVGRITCQYVGDVGEKGAAGGGLSQIWRPGAQLGTLGRRGRTGHRQPHHA